MQTTQTAQNLAGVVAAHNPRVQELVIDTICAATKVSASTGSSHTCQPLRLHGRGGRQNSGNTRRLAQICADACERTYHIGREASELQAAWFTDAHHIGITAGASTRKNIERAVARIKRSFAANHGPDRTRIRRRGGRLRAQPRPPEPGEGALVKRTCVPSRPHGMWYRAGHACVNTVNGLSS